MPATGYSTQVPAVALSLAPGSHQPGPGSMPCRRRRSCFTEFATAWPVVLQVVAAPGLPAGLLCREDMMLGEKTAMQALCDLAQGNARSS